MEGSFPTEVVRKDCLEEVRVELGLEGSRVREFR